MIGNQTQRRQALASYMGYKSEKWDEIMDSIQMNDIGFNSASMKVLNILSTETNCSQIVYSNLNKAYGNQCRRYWQKKKRERH